MQSFTLPIMTPAELLAWLGDEPELMKYHIANCAGCAWCEE